jgi:hypothetical protein
MCASFAAWRCQELGKWWAQFCESKGDFSTAVHYYNISEDALSLVCAPTVERNVACCAHCCAAFSCSHWCVEPVLFQVRIYCFNNEFDTAGELVLESGSRSAAYHLAKQHEVCAMPGPSAGSRLVLCTCVDPVSTGSTQSAR